MKSIVISLQNARERREHIAQEFARLDLPFEFMDATDACDLAAADLGNIDMRYRRRWGLQPLAPAEVACWRSHVRGIIQASTGPDPMIAIFEDDAILRPELPAVLDALASSPVPFDLVSLARQKAERPLIAARPLAAGRCMGRLRYSDYGAFGYVVRKGGAAYLASRITRMRLPIDLELMHFWVHRLNLYFLDAPVVEHDDASLSQLAAGREQAVIGWKKPKLRRLAYRAREAVLKRYWWPRLVKGEIRTAPAAGRALQ